MPTGTYRPAPFARGAICSPEVPLLAFIIAMVLILVGGLIELRNEIVAARREKASAVEWAWIVLPVLFLALIVILAAEAGVRQ